MELQSLILLLSVVTTAVHYSEACTCLPMNASTAYCTSSIVAKVWIQEATTIDGERHYIGEVVNCYDVYKSNAAFRRVLRENDYYFVIDPWAGTSCERVFTVSRYYLITGNMRDDEDELSLMQCNYVQRYSYLTPTEIAGFDDKYKAYCR